MLFEETERKTLQPLPLHVFEISYHIGSNMLTAHRPGDDVTSEVKLLPEGGKIRLELLLDRGSVELYANDGLIPMSFFYISNKENKTISLKCSNGALYLNSMDVYEMNSIWNN
jgi:sucrose-6-phosphate hydrolase SacC (GH32 family)